MTIQRLIDLLTIIASREGNAIIVQVKGGPIKDLCISEENIVLLRTSGEVN